MSNLTSEHKSDKFFDALKVKTFTIILDGEVIANITTRETLNCLVGKLAVTHKVNLLEEGYALLRELNEQLAPDLSTIAKIIMTKKIDVVGDIDYLFRTCENPDCPVGKQHGTFVGAIGSVDFSSFEEAVQLIRTAVNSRGMSTAVGIHLLQQVLESPLPTTEAQATQTLLGVIIEAFRTPANKKDVN